MPAFSASQVLGASTPFSASPPLCDDDAGLGDSLAAAREEVREEVRRMRKVRALDDYERREWFDDLATRLNALIRHLTACGVAPSEFAALQTLVDAFEAGGDVDAIWDRAVTVLEAFATETGRPGS